MPNTLHSHRANVLWSSKPVSKVNKPPPKSTLSAAYQKALFLFWLVSFSFYTVFEEKFYIWKTKWTLGWQLIISITSLLDTHPPHFPIGQQGLWVFSLNSDPQGLCMVKKLTKLCYPKLWQIRQGHWWGGICLTCCFPDPPEKLVSLILKAVNLTPLRNTKFISSPFCIEGHCSSCLFLRITNSRIDSKTVTPGYPAIFSGPIWRHGHI